MSTVRLPYAGTVNGMVTCRGTGISVPLAQKPNAHCVVQIRADKPSGLCEFCTRTEKSFPTTGFISDEAWSQ